MNRANAAQGMPLDTSTRDSEGRSLLRWVVAAAGIPVSVVFASGLVLARTTGLSMAAVWFDVAVVGFVAVLLGLVGAAVRPASVRFGFHLVAGLALHAFVILAGAGSWVARRNWGQNLAGNVVWDFLPHLADSTREMSWGAVVLIAAWIGASGALALVWAALLARRPLVVAPRYHVLALLLAVAGLLELTGGAADKAAANDPVLSLLRWEEDPALSPTPARIAAWVRDEELRRGFDAGTPNGKNLVLILSDGVRPDRLPFHGYARDTMPFLASLVGRGYWTQIPVAYSAATESIGGIGSIVSGRSMRTMSGRSYGIVELLARHGYQTHLLLNGLHNWYELRSMYGSRLTTFRDSRHAAAALLHDDRQVVEWVRELPAAGAEPSFVMLFLMGTHQLGVLQPDEELWSRGNPPFEPLSPVPPGPKEWKHASERYDDQLRAADRRIEEIWKLLEAKGYLRNSLVVFSSDHGQMLGEHEAYGHGDHLWEPAVRIPLVVWSDGPLPPLETRRTAWTPDIAPTLARAAGLEPLPSWEGISLFDATPRDLFATESVRQTRHVRAVFHETGTHRWKLLRETDEDGAVVSEQLFDVVADPSESRDRIGAAPPGLVDRLRNVLASNEPLPARLAAAGVAGQPAGE